MKMLEKTGCFAICIDIDIEQLFIARENLSKFGGRFIIINSDYKNVGNLLKINVDSILIDAGLSSYQLESERGFSFKIDAPLDMRFNPHIGKPVKDLIKELSVEEISEILIKYGDVRNPQFIAKKIKEYLPETTFQLKEILISYLKRERLKKEIAKVFQSFRIYVNDEIQNLNRGIIGSYNVLRDGGRLGVITYHSKEDKIVIKTAKDTGFKKILKGKKPSRDEINRNKKARSAKLRVFEK
jgi:16S rRNA (cytosine1402-N4)-methyltransferase